MLASDLLRIVPHATLFHVGVLSSTMHNAWMRTVAGRLKSDHRHSVHFVYNYFPWPHAVPKEKRHTVAQAADAVLAARRAQPGSTLADLYARDAMPDDLRDAYRELDKAVGAAYGYRGGEGDAVHVAYLFGSFKHLNSELAAPAKPKRKAKSP